MKVSKTIRIEQKDLKTLEENGIKLNGDFIHKSIESVITHVNGGNSNSEGEKEKKRPLSITDIVQNLVDNSFADNHPDWLLEDTTPTAKQVYYLIAMEGQKTKLKKYWDEHDLLNRPQSEWSKEELRENYALWLELYNIVEKHREVSNIVVPE